MKTNTFYLLLLSIGLLVIPFFLNDLLPPAREGTLITNGIVAIPVLTSGITSLIGLISGIRKTRAKAHGLIWIGVIGNFLFICCFCVLLYVTFIVKPFNQRPAYDPSLLINRISANYDTLNHGEVYMVTVRNDSSYFKQFGEQPLMKVFDRHTYPLQTVMNEITVTIVDRSMAEGEVIEKVVPLKLKVKLTPEKDTILTLDKTYYITNLKSTPRSEGQLKNGRKEGLWRFWYDNDRKHLKEESYWNDGLLHGKKTMYWKNGNKWQIYNYQKGLRHGMFYNYDSGGGLSDSLLYANNKEVN
ncbi:toxin-antitoxin system YwqK family antitoxin [Pontibacter populi]|uniref:Uncharacterized protein n=1 Tax=Pontibacter populi TaxID=890055 RepID=A0ABV1RQ80_9BACT